MSSGWLEYRICRKALDGYLQQGYSLMDIGSGAGDTGADFVVRQGDEIILVQLKTFTAETVTIRQREDSPAALRVDLLWEPVSSLVRSADIESTLDEVLALCGDHLNASLLLAWSVLEATMLRVASTYPRMPDGLEFGSVANELAEWDDLSSEQLDEIARIGVLRNSVAHGSFRSIDPADVQYLAQVGREILTSPRSRSVEILDTAVAGTGVAFDENGVQRLASAIQDVTASPTDADLAVKILRDVSEASTLP